MTHATDIKLRFDHAGNLGETLNAAHDAFAAVLSVIQSYQDNGGPFYAALDMAAAAAADGRDAIALAPSFRPPSSLDEALAAPVCAEPAKVSEVVAALSESVTSRLRLAATAAEAVEDRKACVAGRWHAGEVHWLMTGCWP